MIFLYIRTIFLQLSELCNPEPGPTFLHMLKEACGCHLDDALLSSKEVLENTQKESIVDSSRSLRLLEECLDQFPNVLASGRIYQKYSSCSGQRMLLSSYYY